MNVYQGVQIQLIQDRILQIIINIHVLHVPHHVQHVVLMELYVQVVQDPIIWFITKIDVIHNALMVNLLIKLSLIHAFYVIQIV